MPTINRNAIVVTPLQPFLDWLHEIDPDNGDLTLEEIREEPSIYLFSECLNEEEAVARLRKFSKAIFEEELDGWYTDRSVWPAKRDYHSFCRWFHWTYHSVIVDLASEPIERET